MKKEGAVPHTSTRGGEIFENSFSKALGGKEEKMLKKDGDRVNCRERVEDWKWFRGTNRWRSQ